MFKNLLCVKSIITIALIITLCVLCVLYPDRYSETLKNAVTMVVTFYFSHQIEKTKSQKGDESEDGKSNTTLR